MNDGLLRVQEPVLHLAPVQPAEGTGGFLRPPASTRRLEKENRRHLAIREGGTEIGKEGIVVEGNEIVDVRGIAQETDRRLASALRPLRAIRSSEYPIDVVATGTVAVEKCLHKLWQALQGWTREYGIELGYMFGDLHSHDRVARRATDHGHHVRVAILDPTRHRKGGHGLRKQRREPDHVGLEQRVPVDQAVEEAIQSHPFFLEPSADSARGFVPREVVAGVVGVRIVFDLGKRRSAEEPFSNTRHVRGGREGVVVERHVTEIGGKVEVQIVDRHVNPGSEALFQHGGELREREGRHRQPPEGHIDERDAVW